MRPLGRKIYKKLVLPFVKEHLARQRVKLLCWDIWGYARFFAIPKMSLGTKVTLLRRFLSIDWKVPHAHTPLEIYYICRAMSERPGRDGEAFLEAGCWQGGSSAKFSIMCKLFGYKLHIYDSFQGVEGWQGTEYDRLSSPQDRLTQHLKKFGEYSVCSIHPGWFADTVHNLDYKIGILYIDCDLRKGTEEVLEGALPVFAPDGIIFSHDFFFPAVVDLLESGDTWTNLGMPQPRIARLSHNMASLVFKGAPARRASGTDAAETELALGSR